MTEEKLRQGLDACLSGAELTEKGRLRVLAQVKGEEPIMKKKMPLAFTMALTLLILTATAALAVSLTQDTVNWRGEPNPDRIMAQPTPESGDENSPQSTPAPEQVPEENALEQAMIEEEMKTPLQPDEMLIGIWTVNGETEYAARQGTATLRSIDELDGAPGLLPQPAWIPEGYALVSLSASRSAAEYELIGEARCPGGVRVYRYRGVEPFLSGYCAVYENAAGERLTYSATLSENSDGMGFGVGDGDAVGRLEIAGMDDALLCRRGDVSIGLGAARSELNMRRALAVPMPYRSVFSLFGEDCWLPGWDEPYTEVQVRVTATALSGDDLVKVHTGKGAEDIKTN